MAKKYQTVYQDLLKKIRGEVYPDGSKLPSENEMIELYGVSRQTVRQALELLEKDGLVQKVRGSGSYVRGVRRLSTKKIAVIAHSVTTNVFPKTLEVIGEQLFERGYYTVLFSTLSQVDKERKILQQLLEKPVDGVIFQASKSVLQSVNQDLMQKIHRAGTRFIFMNTSYPDEALSLVPRVMMEDYAGAYAVTRELIETGHRSVAGVFSVVEEQLRDRLNGVRKATVDCGLPYEDDNFLLYAQVDELALRLEAKGETLLRCDALICPTGDIMPALGGFLREHGRGNLRTLVLFDEVDYPVIEGLEVLVLRHASREIGKACAEKIMDLIEGKQVESVRFPWTTADGRSYP